MDDVYLEFKVRKDVDPPFEIPEEFKGIKTIVSQLSLEEQVKDEKKWDKVFHADSLGPSE